MGSGSDSTASLINYWRCESSSIRRQEPHPQPTSFSMQSTRVGAVYQQDGVRTYVSNLASQSERTAGSGTVSSTSSSDTSAADRLFSAIDTNGERLYQQVGVGEVCVEPGESVRERHVRHAAPPPPPPSSSSSSTSSLDSLLKSLENSLSNGTNGTTTSGASTSGSTTSSGSTHAIRRTRRPHSWPKCWRP